MTMPNKRNDSPRHPHEFADQSPKSGLSSYPFTSIKKGTRQGAFFGFNIQDFPYPFEPRAYNAAITAPVAAMNAMFTTTS